VTWIEILPAITGMLYAAAAGGYAWRAEWPWAIAFASYALANVGLVWAAVESRG
jgi:hypothetical protein